MLQQYSTSFVPPEARNIVMDPETFLNRFVLNRTTPKFIRENVKYGEAKLKIWFKDITSQLIASNHTKRQLASLIVTFVTAFDLETTNDSLDGFDWAVMSVSECKALQIVFVLLFWTDLEEVCYFRKLTLKSWHSAMDNFSCFSKVVFTLIVEPLIRN